MTSSQSDPTTASPDNAPAGQGAPQTPAPGKAAGTPARPRTRSRTGSVFTTLIAGAVVLILLLVFILENTQSVKVSFFGADGHIALGVALLLAAVGGALLTGLVGGARVLQLRHRLKHPRT